MYAAPARGGQIRVGGGTRQPREVRPVVHSKLLKEERTSFSSALHSIRTVLRKYPRISQSPFHQRGSAASSVSLLSPSKININARNNKKYRGTGGKPGTTPPNHPPTHPLQQRFWQSSTRNMSVLATRPRRRKREI